MLSVCRADRRHDVDEFVVIRLADRSRRELLIEPDAADGAVESLHDIDEILGIEGRLDVRAVDFGGNILIGIADLMYRTNGVKAKTYNTLECLFVAAILYFITTFFFSKLISFAERRMAHERK